MKWIELLNKTENCPVFSTGFLLSVGTKPENVRLQISRWVKSGKLVQLRRGLYSVAKPYCKVLPHPFLVANNIKKASYISLQSALHYYNIIPEHVPGVTSITTGRPCQVSTPFGEFEYRHVKHSWFHSYKKTDVVQGQSVLIATPEKALLDLVYLTPFADCPEYLDELRLQNLNQLNLNNFFQIISEAKMPKLKCAKKWLVKHIENNKYEEL